MSEAPINPKTGEPYFHLDPKGFGGGWEAGKSITITDIPVVHVCGRQLPSWCYLWNADTGVITVTRLGALVSRVLAIMSGCFGKQYPVAFTWYHTS